MTNLQDKKKFNWKRLIYSFIYFAIIAIVAFVSSGGFSNDPDWNAVVGKIITTWCMTAVLIYLSYSERQLAILDDDKSVLVKSINTLLDISNKIYRLGLNFAFKEYSNVMYKKKRDNYLMGKLGNVGISDVFILNLTFEQLKGLLTKPLIVDKHAFDVLTEEQYNEVIKIKTGKYKYKEIPSEYFMTASNDINNDSYGYYANISKHRREKRTKQILLKLGMTVVFAVAFALLAVPDKDKLLEMITTMLSTTVNGIMGILTGTLWARKDAIDHANENNFKSKTLDEFFSDYNSGVFVPTEITDIVKQKLEALEALENNIDLDYEEDYADEDENELIT